jgi:predicted transposase YbfD/YdcC
LEEIWEWANVEENKKWLKKYIELKNDIPSRSTIWRVLNVIDPTQFSKCFSEWVRGLTKFSKESKTTVAIDGKAMKGSKTGEHKWTHIVSAWCSENNLVLGQTKVDDKSNEITAIPELLDILYLKDCVVTMDAMGCQKNIVKKIYKEKKADYLINLKGNQETLHDEVIKYFEDLEKDGVLKEIEKDASKNSEITMKATINKGHGRIEKRKYFWSTDINWMIDAKKDWVGLNGIGIAISKVTEKEKIREDVRYYIGSLKNAEEFSKSAREHWGVEVMHWSLDVTFRDDANTTKKDVAPENLAAAKRIALNMLRNDKEKFPQKSANSKRIRAFGDKEYRDYILQLNFC